MTAVDGYGLAHVLALWADRTLPPDPAIDDKRAAYDRLLDRLPVPADATYDSAEIGGVPVTRVTAGPVARTVVHLHGGGFVMGRSPGYRGFAAALARAARAEVLLVDYGLAPERPFPAGLHDAAAVVRESGASVISGDSAGGGLALATLQYLRDAGDRLPAALVAISPWVDLTLTAASLDEFTDDPVVTKDSLRNNISHYLGDTDPLAAPRASPLQGDLAGLPPAIVLAGARERLRDDAIALAAGLTSAGGAADLHVVAHMPHVWPVFCQVLDEGRDAVASIAAFVDRVAPA
ncbi:MAG: alpha/beta hydrolase [Pseudonocardiaceae bacterium]|nr:MAG: alpha/beta hydrolase [Pseudonocardiaceae bacterium]